MGSIFDSDAATRGALALAGFMLLAAAALAGRLAIEHMQMAAAICGSAGVAHCVWCGITPALSLAGLGALAAAIFPRQPAVCA